ncbi:ATP-binding protein [Sinorhizobium meliloti]|nr:MULTISPECIES: ATP-binding protein [Sinorhizobium]WHS96670.1 ATP-binding protein [Sinorhizobium kummerowiae]
MATAYRELIEQAHGNDLSFDERLGLMLDREIAVRTDRRLTNRLATARLRFADVSIEDIDFGFTAVLTAGTSYPWRKAHG